LRTPEEIERAQNVEQTALQIWVVLAAQKILTSLGPMLSEVIDAHLFDDSDEEAADESWLDDRRVREKEIYNEAITGTLESHRDFTAVSELPGNSDPIVTQLSEKLKKDLEKCPIGATTFREKFSRAQLENLAKSKAKELLKKNPKYSEHIREEVPGSNVKRYGDRGCTTSAGTFIRSSYIDGGGFDTLLSGGWMRVAKERIDPVAWSRLHGFARNSEHQRWKYCFQITARNGQQSPFQLPAEDLAGTGTKVERALKRAGVHLVRRKGLHKALVQFLNFNTRREIVRMPRIGWAEIRRHWVFVRPNEVIMPPSMSSARNVTYEFDATTKQHGLHVAGTAAAWANEVAAPLRGNSNVALSLGTFFAAPLLRWASELGGGNHLHGQSGIGKSMAAAPGQSVYGWPFDTGADDAFGMPWGSSEAGFVPLAFARTDLGLSLDEITRTDPKTAEQTVYKLSGSPDPRATPAGQPRETAHASLLVLSTGEFSLPKFIGKELKEGARKRLVDVPAEVQTDCAFETFPHEQIPVVSRRLFDAMKRQHGAVGRDWQRHLVGLGPDKLTADLDRHREVFLALPEVASVVEQAHPQVRTVVNRFALLAAALRMAIEAKLLPWTVEETDIGITRCMQRWVTQRGNLDTAGEIVRAVEQVEREIMRSLADRFVHIHQINRKWTPVSEDDTLRVSAARWNRPWRRARNGRCGR
jgi:uncharacterized protein (DUF927 family)